MSRGDITRADHQETLRLLEQAYAVCHADVARSPSLADFAGEFVAISRTADEVTIICPEGAVPQGIRAEKGWRAFVVEAPFELASAVGVLAKLTAPIAAAGIALFAVSTWRTDFILVQQDRLAEAVKALRKAGHRVNARDPKIDVVPHRLEIDPATNGS
jgi:uncharacterized protein